MKKINRKNVIKNALIVIICIGLFTLFILYRNIQNNAVVDVVQLNDHIWLLNENDEATGYLVVGERQAALIDTMNGYQNLKKIVREITPLPVIVLNTHGHSDHISGDKYFDEAYLSKKDWNIARRYCGNITDQVKLKDINEGDHFDLGGVTLIAYGLAGHTAGSMCFLDCEDRILFTGDAINRHCWMQLAESLTIAEFIDNMEALEVIREDYDFICHGHAHHMEEATLYEELLEAAKDLFDGNTSMDTQYNYWGGTCRQHQFPSGDGIIAYY